MEDLIARLFKRFDRTEIQTEVEEELRLHVEMLREDYLRQGLTLEQANDEAIKRFGDFERIKNQCVEISRRSNPFMRVLKVFLVLVFLSGVLVRIFSVDVYGRQLGDMLILIGALGRLLLYVRAMSLSSLKSKEETLSPLRLSDNRQMPIAVHDRREHTPVERVISDE